MSIYAVMYPVSSDGGKTFHSSTSNNAKENSLYSLFGSFWSYLFPPQTGFEEEAFRGAEYDFLPLHRWQVSNNDSVEIRDYKLAVSEVIKAFSDDRICKLIETLTIPPEIYEGVDDLCLGKPTPLNAAHLNYPSDIRDNDRSSVNAHKAILDFFMRSDARCENSGKKLSDYTKLSYGFMLYATSFLKRYEGCDLTKDDMDVDVYLQFWFSLLDQLHNSYHQLYSDCKSYSQGNSRNEVAVLDLFLNLRMQQIKMAHVKMDELTTCIDVSPETKCLLTDFCKKALELSEEGLFNFSFKEYKTSNTTILDILINMQDAINKKREMQSPALSDNNVRV